MSLCNFDPFEEEDRIPSHEKPEKKLLGAILLRAITDLLAPWDQFDGAHTEYYRRSAYEWLFEDEGTGLHSYEWICEALGLSAECIRASIRQQFDLHLTNKITRRDLCEAINSNVEQ